MIIRLCEDTPKLALRIVQPGCSGKQLMDTGVEIHITPVECEPRRKTQMVWDGCIYREEKIENPIPSLTYPAFELDDDGRIVFYFDNRLWSLPPGRYHAHVWVGGCCDQTRLDIDLCNRPVMIEQVVTIGAAGCGDTEC